MTYSSRADQLLGHAHQYILGRGRGLLYWSEILPHDVTAAPTTWLRYYNHTQTNTYTVQCIQWKSEAIPLNIAMKK